METIIDNIGWMSFNTLLALVTIIFGIMMGMGKNRLFKYSFAFLWLLFVPNTIYLFTDIIHLFQQYPHIESAYKLPLLLQYAALMIIGAITFYISVKLFEKTFLKRVKSSTQILVGVNFIIGFGIVLGRVQRTNSWEVFTNVPKVIADSLNVLSSLELILLSIFFGLLCNLTYFSMKKIPIVK